VLDKSAYENVNLLKKHFEDVKQEAVEIVNAQLNKFREVKQMGKYFSATLAEISSSRNSFKSYIKISFNE
jgi:hypothetical protein